jgi:hypothetical protein
MSGLPVLWESDLRASDIRALEEMRKRREMSEMEGC